MVDSEGGRRIVTGLKKGIAKSGRDGMDGGGGGFAVAFANGFFVGQTFCRLKLKDWSTCLPPHAK